MTFEKEVAEKVILPKLKEIYNISQGMHAGEVDPMPIKNKADFRKRFMEHEGITISAAKFDEYLSELNITFKKVVVIDGLWTNRETNDAPTPDRPSGRPVEGEDVEITGEEVSFDGEDPKDFSSLKTVDGSGNRRGDMFNQL